MTTKTIDTDPGTEFMAAFAAAMDGSGDDIDTAVSQLATARADVPQDRLDGVAALAGSLVGMAAGDRASGHQSPDDMAMRLRRSRIDSMRALVDRALIDFAEADALTQAQDELAAERATYLARRGELEHSIAVADIDGVIRLRTDIEIGAPKRIADLEIRVADLLAIRAAAEVAPSKSAVKVREREYAKAEAVRADAVAALNAADAALMAVSSELVTARDHVKDAEAQVHRARDTRSALAAGHAQDLARRQRRLAGIPEPADTALHLVPSA